MPKELERMERLESIRGKFAAAAWLAVAWLAEPVLAADQQILQQWARSVVTVEYTANDGQRLASGVVVADDGIVATSFRAAAGASRARVRFHTGETFEVTGFVAGSRGKDLLLLAVRHGESELPKAVIVDRPLEIDEPVHGIGGPASAPLIVSSEKLSRIESGQRYHLSRPAADTTPVDDDQCRLVTHAFLTRASIGGGLFGDDGQLLGILVASSDWNDRIHCAVHARHLIPLLADRQVPRALSGLKNFVDSTDRTSTVTLDQTMPTPDGDFAERGASQREKLHRLRQRLAQLPAERRATDQRSDEWRKEARAPQQALERIQQQVAVNRLQFTTMAPELLVPIPTPRPRPGSIQPPTVPAERRFSPRQMIARSLLDRELFALNLQLAAADAERLRHQSRLQQTEYDFAAIDRYQTQLLRQVFFLCDPLGLRCEADAEDSLAELDHEIEQGGAAGVFLLARGLLRTRLRRWDEALADFEQAAEDDRPLRGVAELARARVLFLRGDAVGRESIAKAARSAKDDPLLETLQARCELDQRNMAAALRWLRAALEHGGDAIELNRALAVVYLQGVPHRDVRKAREHAEVACRLTARRDWHSLAVLAWVQAAAGQWADGQRSLERATDVATGFGLDVCRTWQDLFRRHELPTDLLES